MVVETGCRTTWHRDSTTNPHFSKKIDHAQDPSWSSWNAFPSHWRSERRRQAGVRSQASAPSAELWKVHRQKGAARPVASGCQGSSVVPGDLQQFPGDLLATYWRPTGDRLATAWRPTGDLTGDFHWRPGEPGLNMVYFNLRRFAVTLWY